MAGGGVEADDDADRNINNNNNKTTTITITTNYTHNNHSNFDFCAPLTPVPPPPPPRYGGLGDFFLLLQNATASLPQHSSRKYVVVGGDEMARLARLARFM